MADYIFLKKNGKGADIKVSRQDFAKNPNAYRDYTVRMVDKDGSNWDVPFNHINDAVKDGAHVFNMRDNSSQQKTTTPAPQPKSAVAQQAVNFTQKPAQSYQPTWQEQAGMSMTVDQAANMGGSDVQPMVKPGLDTNMLNQNNALANRAMATNLESNQDNLYLDELEKKAIELQKQGQAEVGKRQEDKGFLGNAFDAIAQARTGTSQYQSNLQANEKMRQGTAIQKNVDDARKAIKDAEISQNGSWYQKLGRGLANGFDVRNFDLGLTDLQNALTLRSALNNPNDVNNAVLDSEALKNKIIKENEEQISNWITAGETTTMMVPFMVQIASSPFSGLGTAASKWAMSKVGQEIAGSLGKRAALLALKGSTRFLGDAVEGAGTATFFNTAGITADALRRQRGNAVGQYGSDGYFHYNEMKDGEDSYAKAFAKAFGASAIEYQSELVGEYFSPLLKGIGKVAGKGLQKAGVLGIKEGFDTTGKKFTNIMLNFGGKNVSLDKTIGMITALSNKQYLKAFNDFTKATRWNGVIGEYAEEVVGNIENAALVGDMNWGTGKNGVFNPEQNWETFLSVAVGSGFMGALGGVSYMGSRIAVNRGLKKSDEMGMALFGADAWRSIKDGFETADNPARFLAAISQNLDEPSKRAIQNYAAYSMAKKGELVADIKQRMEEPQPTNVRITPYKGRFVVQSVDPNGNIIESKDYDSEEDANIYKERVATYIDNARKVQAYNDFILRDDIFDYDYDTYTLLQKIAYKDPLKRTDAEQEFFDNFINSTENITYPINEVHEEHDAQKGADLAEETSENIVEGAKPLNDREAAAKTRWNAVVQSQPDIDSLVGTMVNQGMTSNEIAQRLVDDYGGESEVVEAFCELCNAKANKDGYINRIGQLIQSKVENDIDEASFAGTVNGNEDKSNIYLLTNGTNTFALIGGDITVDSNNNISSNGIAIMLDGQGNRITRPDLTGFSLRGIVDKNQYKQSSLLELQQEATAAIQATETVVPEVQQPQASEQQQSEVQQQEQPQEQSQAQAEEQPQEPAATTENESPIPLGENGEMLYHKAPIEATINYLYDGALEDEEIRDFVQNNIDESTKGYDKTNKKKPKIGTDKNAYLQAKQAWQQQVDEAKQKLDYWNSVNDYIQQQTHTTPEEIQKAQDELSGKTAQQEYAKNKPDMSVTPVQFAGEFIRESKIQTQSFYNETGFGDAERKKFPKMIANDDKTIDSLAEELVSADDTYHNGSLYHGDTTEAKNAILEALQTASKKSELGKNTSDDFKEYERQREEAREAFYEENFNMSYSDYLAFEEQQMPNIWRRMSNFVAEEYDRIVNESYELRDEQNNVEQINNENNGNNTEGNQQLAGGSEVLPTEESNQQGGTSTSTNPAAETANGSEGSNQNEEVPGGTQGVEEKKTLNKEEADYLISLMKLNAEIAEEVELSPENWISLFGEDGTINTPIGQVKMGEGQYFKLAQQGRDGKLGMVKPTLENPVVVIEEERPAKNGVSERNTSYIFVKTFKKADGSRLYYFTSVTVSKDGKEVVISNQEKSENRISKLLQQSKIAWINPEFSLHPNTQIEESVPLNDSNSTTSTDNDTALLGVNSSELSEGKDTTKSPNLQENQQKTDEKVEELQKEEESQLLTEADIDADEIADDDQKALAKDFLNGVDTGIFAQVAYKNIQIRRDEKANKKKIEAAKGSKKVIVTSVPKSEPKENAEKKSEEKPKAESKAPNSDVDAAKANLYDVLKRFRAAGKSDMSVSIVGLNNKQIEMLGELFKAISHVGYTYIKQGIIKADEWISKMKSEVGDAIKDATGWTDTDIDEVFTQRWNTPYLVDGVRKSLSQWAAEEALSAEQKQEEQKQEEENAQLATVPDSSVVGGKRFPFTKQELEGMTKQQMIDAMWHEVFPKVCEMYKVPSDIMDENAYWFSPRMTTGYPKDSLVAACMKYMEHLYDEVQPATEKQMDYIMKLAAEDEKKLFKDITLTKVAASRVISLMQREEDMINDHSSKQEDFAEVYNELEKIARLNGADLSQKDTKKAERKFVDNVAATLTSAMETGEKPYASIVALRKAAREAGMEVGENGETDIKIQELVEDALVRVAKNIMTSAHIAQVANKANNKFAKEIFEKIKLLYNLQPTISMRSSNRIALQQYSTPLPMAFVADMFATGAKAPLFFNVFEPTAGNGMLVFAIPSSQVHVNEIDENRLDNLRGQEFRQVTTQDATQPFAGDRKYNAIVTNPPFGSTEAKDYDGYSISGLAPQIALNALDKMKDNGKAVIIIGGKQEFAPNGAIKNDKPFLAYLYNHYNVKGVIDMDGSLYAKQGTTFPTRMILIDGRRTEEERAKSDVYPPTIKNWINPVADFDRLYDTVNDLINSKEKTNGTEIVHAKDESLQSDRSVTLPGNTDKGVDSRKPVQDVATTGRGLGPNRGNGKSPKRDNTELDLFGGVLGGSGGLSDNPENESGTGGGSGRRTGRDNGPGGKGVDNRLPVDNLVPGVQGTATRGVGLTQEQENRKLDSEKLPYRPHNGAFSLESLAPAAMVEAMDKTLRRIEEEYGNIDEFVTNELGYDSVDAMHKALAAEQVDSVAMAIYNMKKGEALIIGDQTGVGKGRQMAALIRWAHRQGKKPIFMTQKSNLFNDIYRDLKDIGSESLKPFIFNDDSDAKIVEIYENDNGDEKQKIIYRSASKEEINKALKSGKIPDDCDFVLCTYSQISTGDETSKEYETQLSKEEGGSKRRRSRKQNSDAKPKSDKKAILLRKLAKDNYLMLDESHTAAGESNQGFYMQTLVRDSKAVTFASATYAKRPDTMPLYALRTAMSKANIGMKKLIEAIQKGGVTLQEIMSRALTNSGQMVRRERDMEGVVTDWTTIDDPETVKKARENYDKTIKAFNAIIDFQNKYIEPVINNKREDLAVIAGNAGFVKGTEKMGINNTPFASKTYNYTKQLMLALKVDAIVDEVDRQIKAGRKPVIALDNTMGALFDKLTPGEEVTESTFAENLLRGLDSVMQYSQDSGKGREKTSIKISPSELGTEGEAAYYELVSFIKESTKDIFISPLDEITAKLRAKGYNVGELTGRKNVVVEDNGTYRIAKRGKISKQLLQSRFNSGKIDVVILNKTGSTGISLHASKTFADQRQRVMILAQPLPDINDYMQMIGRIDRTGQVKRGYYINLGLPVPAEQRFLMMLSTKLKSLNANTTTSQESKDNKVEAPDMLNKYGSQVIVEYFKDHPDIYNKLDDPLNVKNKDGGLSGYKPSYDDEDARKLTGQVALLSTDEQQAFYDDVIERYNNLIKYLDDSGTNDLKITSLPLNATTLARAVSSEGNDPTGDNPFAQNAYVEKVEMDVLRKPMKANEINNVINTIAKGKDPKQAVEDIKAQYETEFKAKLDKQKRKYEADLERNKETLKKYEDKINSSEKMSEEDKQKAIEDKKESLQQDSDRKNDNAISSLEYEHERMIKALDLFKVGGSYLIPDNLDTLAFDLTSHGIFLGYKAKDNGITPSSTIAVFATLDGRRRVEIKLSEGNKIANVNTTTNQNYDAAQQVNLTNWDNNIPNITRKTGYIITGNILQAINDSQDENGNFTGQLVSYTDSEGNIHDGVLMPDKWEPTMMVNAGNPISSAKADIESGKTVISINGEVEIVPVISRYYPTAIYLRVPRSKKLGAKYYENEDLIRAIGEKEFYQNSGKLQTAIPNGKLDEVLSVLSKMGVKVPSDIVKQLTPQQDNSLAYSSSTNNVNNPRIIPEDVDKDVSLQIENEFDSAIENLNLNEEEKNELENLIGEFSNLGTNDLEYTFYLNNSRLRIRDEKKNNLSDMLWRRGNSVSPSAANVGGNIRDEKSGAESPTTANGEYSAVVSRQSRETERGNTSRGNEVQGQYNGPRDIRNTGSDRLLLHEGRRIEEKVVSQTPRTRLSSHQRRLLAAQYAISRELVYRDIRLAAIKESLGLEAGKQTSLDDVAKIFEKYNKNKEVKALFDKILTINKRLGTSVEILESDENGNYGSAGTRRDVRYYLDGFTRTSSNQNVNIPLVIAHELLHQGTVGAINLVRKGKAEGVLTKEQIDAVNTIIDIYNKVKANEGILSESKRGLANPYEFAAQMVDPRQRRALSMSPLQRVMAAANELKAQGNNSLWERIKNALKTLFGLSDLKKMDNAINTLLDTFNETVHDISMNDVDQNGWGYKVEDKAGLDKRKASETPKTEKVSAETQQRMREKAESLAKSLNTPVKIVTSDEAPERAKNSKGYYDTRTGEVVIVLDNNQSVLDIEKTVVHEIIGHHGLRGLLGSVRSYRQLMNVIYDSLSEEQKNEIKDKAMRNGYKFYEAMDEYFAEQAEYMVWDSSSATMWDNIKHYITEAIHKLGFILRPNYRDVRYWLWLSKNNLQSDNPLSEIKRQAFLYKLSRLDAPKFDDYFNITEGRIDYNDVDTAFRNGDVKSGTTGIILNIKKDDLYTRIKNSVKESYYDHANSLKEFQKDIEPYIQGGLMDNQNAYLGENQRTSNVADAQEMFQKNEITNLQKVLEVITPLFNGAYAKDKLEDLQRYLMKKHGLERNRVLFFRDWFRDNLKKKIEKPEDLPTEAYEIYEKKVIGIETDFEDGRIDQEQRDKALQDAVQESWYDYLENANSGFGKLHKRLADKVDNKTITLADMYRQLDEYINQYVEYNPSEFDYSGLTAFALEKGEELDDAKIIEEVMAIEDSINRNNNEILGKLQDAIHAITQKGLDEDLRTGIISKSAYDRASSMFRWYIPLRGFNKDVMEDFFKYDYTSDVAIGSVLKKAKGRLTLAFNPLATAINMTANSFSRGEKNLNKQRAYRGVTHYLKGHGTKDAIASVSDVWYKKNNTTGEYEIEVPPIDDKMSAGDMRKTMDAWTESMKSLEREGVTKRKTMKGDFIAPFSNIKNKNANIVFLKINGQQKMIIFHGDPKPARVLNGEMAPEHWEYWDDMTRFMSSMATTYNPTFVGANLMRDVLFSNNNIWIKENSRYYRRFSRNQSKILGSMLSIKNIANLTPLEINVKPNSYVVMYDRYKKGIAPETQEEVYFKEFMENGGRTGITQQFDIDRIEKMIKLATTPKEKMKYLKMPLEKFGLFVEALNERVENANRFCAYMTSRQEGRSVMRSISDAKEVTVNFNRKGASWKTAKYGNTKIEKFVGVTAAIFKHGFMFFNAGVQGFAILWNNLDKHAIKTITSMMLPPFLLGLLLPYLNEFLISVLGGDDDDYANLSPWKRRNYLCIYAGNHQFVTIPLPIEQRAFFGLGDIAYSTINNKYSTGQEPFGETMMQIADIFPVDYSKAFTSSESGLVDLMMPDLIKPIWQIHSNRDWTGTMLHKEEAFYNKYDPKYELAFDNENQIAVGIAKLLNKWTSDDKYGLTQGSIDMHPSTIRYLTEQYLGGAGKDALNTMNLAIGLAKLEMNFDCVPFVRGLLQVPNDKNKYTRIKLKYNNYRSESEEYEAKLKKFMKASKSGVKEQADYYKALAEEWKRTKDYRIMVEVNKFIKTKEKRFKKKMDNPALSDTDKKTLQEIFMADKKDLVERIEAIENQY